MHTAHSLPYGGLCPGGSPWQRPPGQTPHFLCPPGQRPPQTDTPQTDTPLDRDPRTETPRQRPRHPPWTDKHLWKHNLRKLCCRAVIMGCTVLSGHIHGCYLVNFFAWNEKFNNGLCTHFYRRQTKFAKVMFSQVLVHRGGRGVCIQGRGSASRGRGSPGGGGSASRGRVSCQSKVDQKCTCSWSSICW